MTIPSTAIELPEVLDLIDGELLPPGVSDQWLENPNPAEPIQPMAVTGPENLERAIDAADRVYKDNSWGGMEAADRAEVLEALADQIEKNAERSAQLEALATGVTITMTGMLSFITHAAFRLAAQQIRDGLLTKTIPGDAGNDVEVHRLPWGPAALLVPWNAPAPMAAHKAASALAAGAPAIIKPSEFAPNGTQIIAEAAAAIGMPPGVLQLVHGGPRVGGAIVTDHRIRSISFTGGLEGGRAIAAACAPDFKPTQLELGGNNPVLILDDADLGESVLGIQMLMTQLNGQWCRALGRLILPESRAAEILDATLESFSSIALGDSLSPESGMGPMIHSNHLAGLKAHITELEAAGGEAHSRTTIPDLPGNFLAPTLITDVNSEDALHEIFGPVGTVHTYSTDDEGIALANATPYGLEGYVFGGDEDRALSVARQIQSGGVKVNGATVMSLSLMAPRPAWGLSGFAEEGTTETIEFFCGTRVVGVEGMQPPTQ